MIARPIQQLDFAEDYKVFWIDIVKKISMEIYGNNFCEIYRKSPRQTYNEVNQMLQVVPITLRKLVDEVFMTEQGESK